MKSIKTKYVLGLGVLLIIVCVGLGLVTYINSAHALGQVVNDLTLKTVTESSKVVEERVKLRFAEVSTWANVGIIKDPSVSIDEKLDYLKKEVERNGYLSVGIGDIEGNVTTLAKIVINLKERPYYQSVLKGNNEVTDPIVSKEDNTTLIVNYAVPIKDDGGKVIGVLIGARNGDELSQITNDILIGKTGTALMINNAGKIIADHDPEKVKNGESVIELSKTDKSLQELAAIHNRIIAGEVGVGHYTYKGIKTNIAFTPVKGTNWFIAVNAPASEILSALNGMKGAIVIASLIFLILSLGVTYFITNLFVKKVKMIVSNLNIIAQGDFTAGRDKPLNKGKDEIAQAYTAMVTMENSVSNMIGTIKDTSQDVYNRSEHLTGLSQQMTDVFSQVSLTLQETAQGITSQATALSSINISLSNFGEKVDGIVHNIEDIDVNSKEIDQMSNGGNKSMALLITSVENMGKIFREFIVKIDGLSKSINKVSDITNIINGVAEQTNLLALNAAIEAARAGEFGKGFSVVASEIGKLAEQSKQSSQNINTLIKQISTDTNLIVSSTDGIDRELNNQVEVINKAIESYKAIVNAIDNIGTKIRMANVSVNEMNREKEDILLRVEDASAVAEQVSASSEQISSSTETVLVSAGEVTSSAVKMGEAIKGMLEQVNQFKV